MWLLKPFFWATDVFSQGAFLEKKNFNRKFEKRLSSRRSTSEDILEQLSRFPYKLRGKHDKYGGDKSNTRN